MHELYPEKVCQVFLVLRFLRLNAGAKNFDYPTSNLICQACLADLHKVWLNNAN